MVLSKNTTLNSWGIGYDDDPHGYTVSDHVDNIDWLMERINRDRVLKAGHEIQ